MNEIDIKIVNSPKNRWVKETLDPDVVESLKEAFDGIRLLHIRLEGITGYKKYGSLKNGKFISAVILTDKNYLLRND